MPPRGRNQRTALPATSVGFRVQERELLTKLERYKGRFDAGVTALMDVHEQAAYEMQLLMRAELEKAVARTGRPQRPGNRLGEALVDERNARHNAYGFQVGIEDFLNSDSSGVRPYWQRLEEGEARRPGGMYGRTVVGMFYDSESGGQPSGQRYRASAERRRRDMRMPHQIHPQGLGYRIEERIEAYGYMEKGARRFMRSGPPGASSGKDWLFREYQKLFRTRYGIEIVRDAGGGLSRGAGNRAL